MANISCTVQACRHNSRALCNLEQITVGQSDNHVTKSHHTQCSSFDR